MEKGEAVIQISMITLTFFARSDCSWIECAFKFQSTSRNILKPYFEQAKRKVTFCCITIFYFKTWVVTFSRGKDDFEFKFKLLDLRDNFK